MIPNSLQRVMRRVSTLALGLAGAYLLSAPIGTAQTVYPITNWDGTILPSAASLYTVGKYCYNPTAGVTVCLWHVRRLYGNFSPAVFVAHGPGGVDPACYSGFTQQIDSGYTRSGCSVYATAAVYGTN